jgi:hypothetical protein
MALRDPWWSREEKAMQIGGVGGGRLARRREAGILGHGGYGAALMRIAIPMCYVNRNLQATVAAIQAR